MLTIIQECPKNGFCLAEPLVVEKSLGIFVGKNGAGKTRLFDAINEGLAHVDLNGTRLGVNKEIKLIRLIELRPIFEHKHNHEAAEQYKRETLALFDRARNTFDGELNQTNHNRFGSPSGVVNYYVVFELVKKIAKRLSKTPSQLTHDELILHYEIPHSKSFYGECHVEKLFNSYIKRRHDNERNQWLREQKKQNVLSYSDEEFKETFGNPPWKDLNAILKATFDGRYAFEEPDENTFAYNHTVKLLGKNGETITSETLSSGERVLFWLSLAMFSARDVDADVFAVPKLLLLDEPDAYLHPKMVNMLYALLREFEERFATVSLFITHSPTTVALAPVDKIYYVENNTVRPVEKDAAVSQLLDGVPQIAINPANRRQVFVESFRDANILQSLFDCLKNRSANINSSVSLTFVSSGPKMPNAILKQNARKVFGVSSESQLDEFVAAVNGVGDCVSVYGIVETLAAAGVRVVRGSVDWDEKNVDREFVHVLAKDRAYAIENVILEPTALLLCRYFLNPNDYAISSFVGENVTWKEWIGDDNLLQHGVDFVIRKIFNDDNRRDQQFKYFSGNAVHTDSRYLRLNGHALEAEILRVFPELNRVVHNGNSGCLMEKLVQITVIAQSDGALIPTMVEEHFITLQRAV